MSRKPTPTPNSSQRKPRTEVRSTIPPRAPATTSSQRKHKRMPVALYIGLGILAIALVLIFLKDIFPGKNKVIEQSSTSSSDIETRFREDGSLTFSKNDGRSITEIAIEIADNEQARTQGLMGRKVMKMNHGMLFVFDEENEKSFWMVNTPLSLDIIFVNAEKKIVKIHRNTTPYSDGSLPSEKPAQYTIEVVGGFCAQHKIEEGDAVNWLRK